MGLTVTLPAMSEEQEAVIATSLAGHDVIVDSVIGSGKTTTIQELCNRYPSNTKILYLTYSKLLKLDAQAKIRNRNVVVQNYHGIAWRWLHDVGMHSSVSSMIAMVNDNFPNLVSRGVIGQYDVIIIDEYQDITTELSQLLMNLRSVNKNAQIVMVGDLSQKLHDHSTLDISQFIRDFTFAPIELQLTKSFRMGPELAKSLGRAWQRNIEGVNVAQRVAVVDEDEAYSVIRNTAPKDLLVLGKRNGQANEILNRLERELPSVFNKNTVYASIRNSDSIVRPSDTSAIFTTYDSSKGLERKRLFVFDFDYAFWLIRRSMPGTNPEILRNVFLVAASRGKEEIYFVAPPDKPWRFNDFDWDKAINRDRIPKNDLKIKDKIMLYVPFGEHKDTNDFIGGIYEGSLEKPEKKDSPIYSNIFSPYVMFDFVYTEDVDACYNMLDLERLKPASTEIQLPDHDGLIDLSLAVGLYQEAVFFEGWTASKKLFQIARDAGENFDVLYYLKRLSGVENNRAKRKSKKKKTRKTSDENETIRQMIRGNRAQNRDDKLLWRDCLVLAEAQTKLERYTRQVDVSVLNHSVEALVARIGTYLDPKVESQGMIYARGIACNDSDNTSPFIITGRVDALDDNDMIWEIRFSSELRREDFCQVATYLAVSGEKEGRLLNTRTGELWSIKVPEPKKFLDAVVYCASKREYRHFDAKPENLQYRSPETVDQELFDIGDRHESKHLAMLMRKEREKEASGTEDRSEGNDE